MTRVYIPDMPALATRVELPADEAHHLARVVRARAGDEVRVFDGRGREWQAHVSEAGRDAVVLALDGPVTPVAEPVIHVTLGIGVLKGDQMDTVVRDATVMGVSAIVPLATDHVTVPARAWREDAAGARWRRVAVAAAKQCGRSVVPEISTVTPLADLSAPAGAGMVLACVEPAASPAAVMPVADWRARPRPGSVLLLVGPEGGWSADEMAWIRDRGALPVSLGPRTLRADAAPMVALTMVWATWGW